MALDKQRILHELGSVVNQLQSADCGCIGKLFSDSNQPNPAMGSPLPMTTPSYGGCRHNNCCHNHNHGYGSAGVGDSYGQMQAMNPMNQQPSAMNQMTPMNRQPINQMPCMGRCNPPKLYADTYGYLNQNLMQPIVKEVYDDLKSITPANTVTNNNALAGQMGLSAQGNGGGGANASMGGMAQYGTNNGLQGMGQNQQMPEGANANYYQGNVGSQEQQMAQMAGMGPDIVKMIMGDSKPNNAGQPFKMTEPMVLDAPQSPHGKIGVTPLNTNKGQYGMMQAMPQSQMNQGQNSANTNQMMQMQQPNMNNTQQNISGQQNMYGQHTQGVKKFNEMFPGVMQGLGGDNLGFDPMAIAIQMNPANHHKNAVNTMAKMLMGQDAIKSGINAGRENVVIPAETSSSINAQTTNKPNEIQSTATLQGQNQQAGAMTMQQQQQVYTATGQPTFVTQDGNLVANTNVEIDQQQPEAQGDQLMNQEMKEPLLPADTAQNQAQKYYEYNTLGQPVELLPADCYKQQPLSLPQTLSPQPVPMRSNVKNTVSKTSLMANRPVGKTPSRSQLQQIYHQYKGSQSNTQQMIRPTQGGSHSEGKLNSKLERVLEGTVEKVGGDSAANNNNNQAIRVEPVKGQVGDVTSASKPHGDVAPTNVPVIGKGRNGLQDMVFTSYPTSTAWSFHGERKSSPYAYRYNNMNQQRNYRNVA